jgi:membrane peptidoglycan carboxypeptidase
MYVAGNSGTGDLDNYARPGDSTFFGGTYPALTWANYMKVATRGQAVKEFPKPAYVNRDEVPQPSQTAQETLQPTDEPTTDAPKPQPEPTQTWKWPSTWPTPSNPMATQTRKGPGGGKTPPPRLRRLLPGGNPTGGRG